MTPIARKNSWLPVVAALALAAPLPSRAVQLNDVRPDRLEAFVKADRVAVVLFTSPDPKCGYCVGQLNVFNAAAVHYRNEPPVFAYVQWKPWREFPRMNLPRRLYGIPHVMVFRNGEVLGELEGRFADPAKLVTLVDDALAGKLKPLPHVATPPEEPAASAATVASAASGANAAALSDADRAAVSLFLRQELLTAVSRSCATRHPAQADAAQQAEAAWKQRHGQAAGRGMLIAMGAGNRSDLRALIDPLGKAQAQQLEGQLPVKKDLQAADCERVFAFMAQDAGPSAVR